MTEVGHFSATKKRNGRNSFQECNSNIRAEKDSRKFGSLLMAFTPGIYVCFNILVLFDPVSFDSLSDIDKCISLLCSPYFE